MDKYKEIVTYPTLRGDIKMKNKHVGVNFDDRDIPKKELPKENVEGAKKRNFENLAKSLQGKNVKYNKDYYSKVVRRDHRAVDTKEIEDPRALYEIEQENLDLKEQFIHQMMTMEQYFQVA